jgi:hypothetical protein
MKAARRMSVRVIRLDRSSEFAEVLGGYRIRLVHTPNIAELFRLATAQGAGQSSKEGMACLTRGLYPAFGERPCVEASFISLSPPSR